MLDQMGQDFGRAVAEVQQRIEKASFIVRKAG